MWIKFLVNECAKNVYFNLLLLLQVESVLDKENFTLEELLDEEEIIQECKALNSRLINL